MPRIARRVVKGEPGVYHVVSRAALDGFVFGDAEKEYLGESDQTVELVFFHRSPGTLCHGVTFLMWSST